MSTTPEHLDPIVVAEHAEGLLPPGQAQAVREHLDRCPACAALAESLSAVSAELASAPPELPIPVEVAARIDRALADEAAGAHVLGLRDDQAGDTAGPFSRWRAKGPALLAAAAAIGAIGFAGYALSGVVTSDGGNDSLADLATSAGDALDDAEPESAAADGDAGTEVPVEADADDDAADDSPEAFGAEARRGQDSALAPDDPALMAAIREIASGEARDATMVPADCGAALADELGRPLVGAGSAEDFSSEAGSAIVVVEAEGSGEVTGWLLPACSAGADDAMVGPVDVTLD